MDAILLSSSRNCNIFTHPDTYPGANCEEAISPGFRPAAAAMAAILALVGSWPCRAADRLGAATITCPVPSVLASEDGAWVTVVMDSRAADMSAEDTCSVLGVGLREGEEAAVVTAGTVEITDAVLEAEPMVVPGKRGQCSEFTRV